MFAQPLLPDAPAAHRLRVAVNVPVPGQFDYSSATPVPVGARVKVRFGFQGAVVGVVTQEVPPDDPLPGGIKSLRAISSALDRDALLPDDVRAMADFASRYYHHPAGEVYATALPNILRKGEPAKLIKIHGWTITEEGLAAIEGGLRTNAVRQQALLDLLRGGDTLTRDDFIGLEKGWRTPLKAMVRKGWVRVEELTSTRHRGQIDDPGFTLCDEQDQAVAMIEGLLGGYRSILLDGVTGSGKTEVYLRATQAALDQGRQVLVLVPEIGLTPQTVRRFQRRFDAEVLVLHSGLTDKERADAWLRARAGLASVIVGTRSAVWTPMPNLGLIVVDEEHDRSFKQQEGFRYNARDLAIWRAKARNCPIVLGSATPSLETMHHAVHGRYERLVLSERAGGAQKPELSVLDMTGTKEALHQEVIAKINATVERGEQALVFLNRRGYSPCLLCEECGALHECPQCDTQLVVHERRRRMECHWCGERESIPNRCKSCGSPKLTRVGHGTERLDEMLVDRFPKHKIVRIDSDTAGGRGAMEEKLAPVRRGEPCILVGTQMITKGHHLPNLTLVVVVNVDGALFSTELKSQEWLAQTLIQVAGRAGRAEKPGLVIVQTRVPDNPLLRSVLDTGYHRAIADLDVERRDAGMPPYSFLAVVRFSSPDPMECERFGVAARSAAAVPQGVRLAGPMPAGRARVGGRWQHYFIAESKNRGALHTFLSNWTGNLGVIRKKRGLRWSVDVDPYEMF